VFFVTTASISFGSIIDIVRDLKTSDIKVAGKKNAEAIKPGKATLLDLISGLADGNFFKQPKDLASIKAALAEQGHHFGD